jgi:phosphoribosylformylglycinamidine cyclo-ligase
MGLAVVEKITYKDAGVDTELADSVIKSLRDELRTTFRSEVFGQMGGFSALFRPNWRQYKSPILVSTTDGVGTKLKIAFMTGIHDSVGLDLVAMNVNDILVSGAEPLFFLDYFATGKLDAHTMKTVVKGIARGCLQAGCSLIGGETAEMPDFYQPGEYDLAGFCVGMVDEANLVNGTRVREGDNLIGLASSGLHSNGFSLVRKALLEKKKYPLDRHILELGKSLGEELLTPTAIYVKPILKLMEKTPVNGMVHITGGGFVDNIPRVLSERLKAVVELGTWKVPPIFGIIQHAANLENLEMFETFNMGVGFIVILGKEHTDRALALLNSQGIAASIIGVIEPRSSGEEQVAFV